MLNFKVVVILLFTLTFFTALQTIDLPTLAEAEFDGLVVMQQNAVIAYNELANTLTLAEDGYYEYAGAWLDYENLHVLLTSVDAEIIDNYNKIINALGYTANPQYTETSTDDDSNDESDTYTEKNLNVYYEQRNWSLLPRISIGNNPYRNALKFKLKKNGGLKAVPKIITWELSVGYQIPIHDWGGIKLVQDDGNGNSNKITKPFVNLNTQDLTFTYNGKKITSPPFRLSGLYVSLAIRFGLSRYW